MTEVWKPVKGYENKYEVSSFGNIRSINYHREKRSKIMKVATSHHNYKRVALCKNNILKKFLVHRLVAEAFIPNPDNKQQVNHKNGIASDNRVENLEWVTSYENMQHAYKYLNRNDIKNFGLYALKNNTLTSKPIIQIKDGIILARYPSISEASRITGLDSSSIAKVARGILKSCGKYQWRYD